MKEELVAREYARILDRFAHEEGAALVPFFREIDRLARTAAEFRHFLNHPAIALDAKLQPLRQLAGRPLSELAERVISDIVKRRLSPLFAAIADEMEVLADRAASIQKVAVVSTRQLSDAMRKTLIDALSGYTGGGVKVAFSVEPALLAGLLIKIGDTIIDNTVRTDLQRIRRQLLSASST